MNKNCDCKCQTIEVKFEDKSQNVNLNMSDKSQNINIEMAPIGNTIVDQRTEVLRGTTDYWNSQRYLISRKNVIYLYTDYIKTTDPETGELMYNYGLKIGDGLAYLIDIPFVGGVGSSITPEMINFWNNKWSGYLDATTAGVDDENLVFTVN